MMTMTTRSKGKKTLIEIPAFATMDGDKVCVSAHIIHGSEDEPTVYVGSATHGNELQGVETCRRLAEEIDPATISGKLIVVPLQNPVAFRHRVRLNPVDGKDLDKLYPGNDKGTATEQLADTLYTKLAATADVVIDLHSGGVGSINIPHIYVPSIPPKRTKFTSLELGQAFGADVLIDTSPSVDYHFDLEHLSPYFCNVQGSAGLYVELGEGGRVDEHYVQFALTGVKNVLRKLGMLKGRVEEQGKRKVVTRTSVVRSKTSGILLKHYKLGQEVHKGNPIAEVVGVFGGREKILAPCDGIVQWTVTFGNTDAGQDIAWLGHN
jgi:predicted deacylase